jgi:glycosyltransferase involved in cell wall biosynthesis
MHPTLGNFVLRHAEAVATKHRVHVLYLAKQKWLKHSPEIEEREEHGVRITTVYYSRGISKTWSRWKALQTGIRHLQATDQWHFDLVHHHVTWPEAWQFVVIRKRFRLPVVLTEHWTGYLREARGKLAGRVIALSRWASRFVSVFAPVTAHLGEHMRHYGMKGKYRVVPNVVDTSLFRVGKKATDRVNFLHVSSLDDPHKNISGILRAWKKASEQRSDIHLHIGGDGPWEALHDAAMRLGIAPGCISFFGEQPWEVIADYMRDAHTLLLFSNYENLPCVIVEALASGMRIISSDVGGISEYIDDSRGTLIARKDEAGLAEAILKEADLAASADRQALRKYADAHFSMGAIAAQFDAIYREVMQPARHT